MQTELVVVGVNCIMSNKWAALFLYSIWL